MPTPRALEAPSVESSLRFKRELLDSRDKMPLGSQECSVDWEGFTKELSPVSGNPRSWGAAPVRQNPGLWELTFAHSTNLPNVSC